MLPNPVRHALAGALASLAALGVVPVAGAAPAAAADAARPHADPAHAGGPSAPPLPDAAHGAAGAPLEPAFARVSSGAEAGTSLSDACTPESPRALPSHAQVVVVRTVGCEPRRGRPGTRTFVEVLFHGRTLLVEPSAITPIGTRRAAESPTPQQLEANLPAWRAASVQATERQLASALEAVRATATEGVALLDAELLPPANGHGGAGFSASIRNSGTKPIRSVTFSVIGFDRTHTPITDRARRILVMTMPGPGPIAPGATGRWSNPALWTVPGVDRAEVKMIRVDWVDGSWRNLRDVAGLRIGATEREMLAATAERAGDATTPAARPGSASPQPALVPALASSASAALPTPSATQVPMRSTGRAPASAQATRTALHGRAVPRPSGRPPIARPTVRAAVRPASPPRATGPARAGTASAGPAARRGAPGPRRPVAPAHGPRHHGGRG